MGKQYKLTDVNGNIYLSDTHGEYGGNSKLKVYGRLICGRDAWLRQQQVF